MAGATSTCTTPAGTCCTSVAAAARAITVGLAWAATSHAPAELWTARAVPSAPDTGRASSPGRMPGPASATAPDGTRRRAARTARTATTGTSASTTARMPPGRCAEATASVTSASAAPACACAAAAGVARCALKGAPRTQMASCAAARPGATAPALRPAAAAGRVARSATSPAPSAWTPCTCPWSMCLRGSAWTTTAGTTARRVACTATRGPSCRPWASPPRPPPGSRLSSMPCATPRATSRASVTWCVGTGMAPPATSASSGGAGTSATRSVCAMATVAAAATTASARASATTPTGTGTAWSARAAWPVTGPSGPAWSPRAASPETKTCSRQTHCSVSLCRRARL
mmetsp:Transcript_70804/g.118392  ORF Transcript_70804/g.118392 Transcript_70804/m.118392 type:complete len:346 (-) Transcript_70804:1761-2798(-)